MNAQLYILEGTIFCAPRALIGLEHAVLQKMQNPNVDIHGFKKNGERKKRHSVIICENQYMYRMYEVVFADLSTCSDESVA